MNSKTRQFIASFDAFGEPVSLNFKGDSSYKTLVSAFFSIEIKSFIIVFAA